MPVLPAIATRAAAKAATWAPMRNLLAGAAAYYTRHYNASATEPALELWQTDATSTAPVFWSRYSSAGTKGIEHLVNGISLRSPDGTNLLQVNNTAISMTGDVTIGGVAVGGGMTVYNVVLNSFGSGYQLVTGSTSASAASNTAALAALYAAVGAAGGGVIYFPPGTYPLNATTFDHGLAYGVSISLQGAGRASILKFYGSSGPFMNFAPASGSTQRWYMRELLIQHDSVSTGACIYLSGSISKVVLQEVEIAAGGFLVGVQSAHSTDLFFEHCKINTRTDYSTMVSGALTPVALDLVNSATMGGVFLHQTELGCVGKGSNPAAYGTIMRFNNSGAVDTVVLGDGCHLIGGAVGILKNGNTGNVSNVLIGKAYITDTEICEKVEPPSGVTAENWLHTGTWLDGRDTNVLVSKSNSGTPTRFTYTGCYLTNATNWGFYFGPGVNVVSLTGNEVITSINTSGRSGIEIGDGTTASESISLIGGIVVVGASSDASYKIGSAVDAVTVAHVTQRGVVGAFNGTTSTSRVHAPGAFKA